MSAVAYGPAYPWWAWRPVDTRDRGWTWLSKVYRRRVYLDLPGAPGPFWEYTRHAPSRHRPVARRPQRTPRGEPDMSDLIAASTEQLAAELSRRAALPPCPCRRWQTYLGIYDSDGYTLRCHGCLRAIARCTCG